MSYLLAACTAATSAPQRTVVATQAGMSGEESVGETTTEDVPVGPNGNPGQPPKTELRAGLEIPHSLPIGEAVNLRFFLINDTDSPLYLLNWFTPLEGLGGEIFRVARDGELVPYQGPLASRAEPGPDSYTMLEAGEIVSAEVDLSKAYDFSIPGDYTIEFISPRVSHVARSEAEMAKTFDDLGPVQIPANEVTVKIVAESFSSTDSGAARDTLIRYFSLLSEGKYADGNQ